MKVVENSDFSWLLFFQTSYLHLIDFHRHFARACIQLVRLVRLGLPVKFKSDANKNFEIMILFQNFWENKSLFSSPVYISESYFVLKIVANHQKCQSYQVCQVNSSEKLMNESLFFSGRMLFYLMHWGNISFRSWM